jgi:hypothetical protein
LEAGVGGVDAGRRLGEEALDRTKSVTGKLSSRLAERTRRGCAGNKEG